MEVNLWPNLKLIVLRISIKENQNGAQASVQVSCVRFYGHLSKV
jgi:hypothetical protein